MRQTVDWIFLFRGLGGCESRCRLRVYKDEQKPAVVIATELSDNPGTSITNAAGALATQVWQALEFPPRGMVGMVWTEHYPQEGAGERYADRERYAVATFTETREGFQNPNWRYVTKEDVERLVG